MKTASELVHELWAASQDDPCVVPEEGGHWECQHDLLRRVWSYLYTQETAESAEAVTRLYKRLGQKKA